CKGLQAIVLRFRSDESSFHIQPEPGAFRESEDARPSKALERAEYGCREGREPARTAPRSPECVGEDLARRSSSDQHDGAKPPGGGNPGRSVRPRTAGTLAEGSDHLGHFSEHAQARIYRAAREADRNLHPISERPASVAHHRKD